jgi:hypothetical protein
MYSIRNTNLPILFLRVVRYRILEGNASLNSSLRLSIKQ